MDDLPFLCVEKILSFLPLKDMFVCKSVCWMFKFAADYVIKNWDLLVLSYGEPVTIRDLEAPAKAYDRPVTMMEMMSQISLCSVIQSADGMVTGMNHNADAETWIKRLNDLTNLKKIRFVIQIEDGKDCFWDACYNPFLDGVTTKNAAHLEKLDAGKMCVIFDEFFAFHHLQVVKCSYFELKSAAFCPRLVTLMCEDTTLESVRNLPADTMQCLDVGYSIKGGNVEQVVVAAGC